LELRPAELLGCASTVAIRAANITESDFEFESRPSELTHQARNRTSLSRAVAMIEFEHDRVRLAAVNAGMADEMVEDTLAAILAVQLTSSCGAPQIRGTVPLVVFA
jgi:hypothetical protein